MSLSKALLCKADAQKRRTELIEHMQLTVKHSLVQGDSVAEWYEGPCRKFWSWTFGTQLGTREWRFALDIEPSPITKRTMGYCFNVKIMAEATCKATGESWTLVYRMRNPTTACVQGHLQDVEEIVEQMGFDGFTKMLCVV